MSEQKNRCPICGNFVSFPGNKCYICQKKERLARIQDEIRTGVKDETYAEEEVICPWCGGWIKRARFSSNRWEAETVWMEIALFGALVILLGVMVAITTVALSNDEANGNAKGNVNDEDD